MESRKICKLLILIFLVLSLLFYYLYNAEIKKRTVIPDELVLSAVQNLESRGIEIDESVIQKVTPERDIYCFDVSEKSDFHKNITSSLFTSIFTNEVVTTEFDTPDGYSVGIYDKSSSEKELGRILFSQNDNSFVFSKNGLSMKNGDEPIENMQTDDVTEEIAAFIEKTVVDLTNGYKLGYRIKGSSSNDMYLIVTVMQTIDGSDISNAYMNFVFQDDELVILYSDWICDSPKAMYHNTLLDGVNVLYKLRLDDVKEIISQEVVYTSKNSNDNKGFIIPCWRIRYLDKNEKIVTEYFDAL